MSPFSNSKNWLLLLHFILFISYTEIVIIWGEVGNYKKVHINDTKRTNIAEDSLELITKALTFIGKPLYFLLSHIFLTIVFIFLLTKRLYKSPDKVFSLLFDKLKKIFSQLLKLCRRFLDDIQEKYLKKHLKEIDQVFSAPQKNISGRQIFKKILNVINKSIIFLLKIFNKSKTLLLPILFNASKTTFSFFMKLSQAYLPAQAGALGFLRRGITSSPGAKDCFLQLYSTAFALWLECFCYSNV